MSKKEKPIAYKCPSCGKEMKTSSSSVWICSMGHWRFTQSLQGIQPWKDRQGNWHSARSQQIDRSNVIESQ